MDYEFRDTAAARLIDFPSPESAEPPSGTNDTAAAQSSGLKGVAPSERPQERLEAHGAGALSDTELLAMLLRSGSAKHDVLSVASQLLKEAGSLARLLSWNQDDFSRQHGIGKVKALQLITVFEIARRVILRQEDPSPLIDEAERVYQLLNPVSRGLPVEKFWVLCLNTKNRLIRRVEVSSGTVNSSLAHPREVFREAIRSGATAIIIAHNHPSGDPAPSRADIHLTSKLKAASEVICIDLLDHVIIGHQSHDAEGLGYYSFADHGLL